MKQSQEHDLFVLPMWERVLRVVLGTTMVSVVMWNIFDPISADLMGWMALAPLLAIYPILTGMTGWELILLGAGEPSRPHVAAAEPADQLIRKSPRFRGVGGIAG